MARWTWAWRVVRLLRGSVAARASCTRRIGCAGEAGSGGGGVGRRAVVQGCRGGGGRKGACVCLDVGVEGAMDLGMAGRGFGAWVGCGACILQPADRVRRRGGDQVAALSVRNALSVRRNHSPDCGWNFEQISIGAL